MTRLSADELDDIKARNPIADVASGYTKLRRAGGRLVGPCPMCGGRASSQRFEIKEKDQSWVCAAYCQDGGDVISLVQKVEGCDFKAAIERLGGRVAIDAQRAKEIFEERERKRLAREKTSADYREAERKRLFRTWKGAMPIHDTGASRYLDGRGLMLPAQCPGLRYLPSLAYFHGEQLDERGRKSARQIHSGPAMLGAFIRPDSKFGGLHLTWLNPKGAELRGDDLRSHLCSSEALKAEARVSGLSESDALERLVDIAERAGSWPSKAEILDPDTGEILNAKKMRGSKTGAYIAIVKLDAPRRLVIGEGIETVLSVFTAMRQAGRDISDMAFWAAGDLGNLAGRAQKTVNHPTLKRPNGRAMTVPNDWPDPDDPGLAIPDSVEELILLGDGDSEPVLTEYAMRRAARRYARPGRKISIAFAPAGLDFNDVLRAA